MMGEPGFIIAIVAIICATSLIRTWLNKKGKSGIEKESFNRLAKAFMPHKEMQKQVQNLETITAEHDVDNYSQVETSHGEVTLTNDLKEKNRIRS